MIKAFPVEKNMCKILLVRVLEQAGDKALLIPLIGDEKQLDFQGTSSVFADQ